MKTNTANRDERSELLRMLSAATRWGWKDRNFKEPKDTPEVKRARAITKKFDRMKSRRRDYHRSKNDRLETRARQEIYFGDKHKALELINRIAGKHPNYSKAAK